MTTNLSAPAMNVVVYAEPGPGDDEIARCAAKFVEENTLYPPGGGLGYLTLVPGDFDRLWNGVDAGDACGTAGAVLRFLGPSAQQFIGRHEDFIFGWIGEDETEYGRVLLLQIIPRPHLLSHWN